MPSTRPASVVVLAVACLLLTACAGSPKPTPSTPSRTPTPTPTPTPTRSVAAEGPRVVIDGEGVRVYDESGESTLELTYAVDPQTAATRLDEVLDEQGVQTTVTDDRCYPQLDESSWGGLHIWSSADGLTRPETAQFYVTADAAETGSGIPIRIPSGQSVGAPKSKLLAANASSPSFADGQAIDLHYDIVSGSASGDPDQYFGALAKITDNHLVQIDAPVYFSRPC